MPERPALAWWVPSGVRPAGCWMGERSSAVGAGRLRASLPILTLAWVRAAVQQDHIYTSPKGR